MITQEDIKALNDWSHTGHAKESVRTWHAQIIAELIDYICYLESKLIEMNEKNINLSEEIRFLGGPVYSYREELMTKEKQPKDGPLVAHPGTKEEHSIPNPIPSDWPPPLPSPPLVVEK